MEDIKKYQATILVQAPFLKADNEYHNKIKAAFLNTPRHLFVRRFKEALTSAWTTVTEENLSSLLPLLYANRPLYIYDEPGDEFKSAISQPYIVLQMLELLELKKGNTVFEVGAASGWNAALMGALVETEGHVYSAEIIPPITQLAKENIEKSQISNVTILQGDAGFGYEEEAPFDRVIFTAGIYDLPACFFHQLKNDGILLLVLGTNTGLDLLLQLKKSGDHFEALKTQEVQFVKMTGKYQSPGLEPEPLTTLPEWAHLQDKEVGRTPFWWGGLAQLPFVAKTAAFRTFLGLTDPGMRSFRDDNNTPGAIYFGSLNNKKDSLTIAKENELITYGNEQSKLTFMQSIYKWVDLGMPGGSDFKLKIYPKGIKIPPTERQWVDERTDSTFVWSL